MSMLSWVCSEHSSKGALIHSNLILDLSENLGSLLESSFGVFFFK